MGASDARRGMTAAGWVALAAVALAVVPGLGLAFYPVYQGESETVSSTGVVTSSSDSATLIDENGSWVALLLCVPVVLAALGLWAALRGNKTLAGVFACVLLALCVLGGLSIGLYYFPAGLSLLLAASLTERRAGRRRSRTRPHVS